MYFTCGRKLANSPKLPLFYLIGSQIDIKSTSPDEPSKAYSFVELLHTYVWPGVRMVRPSFYS
jgi:hypothetical protein